MTVLAALQPSYLPWVGYFDQIDRSDVFVFYDDVQFDRGGWRNRNRIKTSQGLQWLTVPVEKKGRAKQLISETRIDHREPWGKKHLRGIEQAYAKAPYMEDYLHRLGEVLSRDWVNLSDLDIELTKTICGWLGVSAEFVRSSDLHLDGDRNERLVELCRRYGADRYLTGAAARDYLDLSAFNRLDIDVEFQVYQPAPYAQLHGEFVSHLSIVDLILNIGDTSFQILRAGRGEDRNI